MLGDILSRIDWRANPIDTLPINADLIHYFPQRSTQCNFNSVTAGGSSYNQRLTDPIVLVHPPHYGECSMNLELQLPISGQIGLASLQNNQHMNSVQPYCTSYLPSFLGELCAN